MHQLPWEIKGYLFLFLDPESIKSARLVCRQWTQVIAEVAGINIIIDDRRRGNVLFVKTVDIIRKIRLVSVRERYTDVLNDLSYPGALHYVILSGPVHSQILCRYLPKFRNLSTLIIENNALLQTIWQLNNATECLQFPSLKTLKISLKSATEYRRMSLKTWTKLTVAKNLFYLLSIIRATKLSCFDLQGCWGQINLPNEIDWKNIPITNFLSFHHKNLKEIVISEYIMDVYEGQQEMIIPENITNVSLCFDGLDNEAANHSFWGRLIENQHRLEEMNILLVGYPRIPQIIQCAQNTLKSISIQWGYDYSLYGEENRTFDMTAFSKCRHLEALDMLYFDLMYLKPVALTNIRSLTCTNLRFLGLSSCNVLTTDLLHIKDLFPKLEVLHSSTASEEQSDNYGFTNEVFREIISMRNLHFLHVDEHDINDLIDPVFWETFTKLDHPHCVRIGREPVYTNYLKYYDIIG